LNKITVTDYAKKHQITRQTVYNKVKKGLLDSIEENGVLFVIDEDKEVLNSSKKDDCQKFIKKLLKRIEKLEEKLDKAQDQKLELAMSYVNEMKALYLPKPIKNSKKKKKGKK